MSLLFHLILSSQSDSLSRTKPFLTFRPRSILNMSRKHHRRYTSQLFPRECKRKTSPQTGLTRNDIHAQSIQHHKRQIRVYEWTDGLSVYDESDFFEMKQVEGWSCGTRAISRLTPWCSHVCDLCSEIDVDAIQSYRKVTDHGESLPGTTLRHSVCRLSHSPEQNPYIRQERDR